MQINPSGNSNAPVRTPSRTASAPSNSTVAPKSDNNVELQQSDKLNALVDQATDTRPDAVERAKGLIADQHYPPEAVVRGMARLIGKELTTADGQASTEESAQ